MVALGIFGGVLYVVTDGDIINQARTAYSRFLLIGRQDELNTPYSNDASVIRIEIPIGTSSTGIAQTLANNSIITDVQLFVDYARSEGLDTQFEAGIYFLNQTQTIPEIAYILTDSSKSYIPFRILEGARIEEVADLIESNPLFSFSGNDFLGWVYAGTPIPSDFATWAGIPSGASLEGFMVPDTYQLPPNITAEGLRNMLLDTFRERIGDNLRDDAARAGYTLHEMVTLASIIEREAVHPDEYALISSVYRNRLDIDMLLQADPTVQYGIQGTRGSWWPNITRADYRDVNSPYNTYLYGGLPPGPIASPSLAAVDAAIYPTECTYYYFRARCDGSNYHNFATTYEEHEQNAC